MGKNRLSIFLLSAIFAGCTASDIKPGPEPELTLVLKTGEFTKSVPPDENLISDANIFVFNRDGLLEQKLYVTASQMSPRADGFSCGISLLNNCRYSIYICANIGFSMPCSTLEDLLEYRYHMAYPDDYRTGMLMCGALKDFIADSDAEEIVVPLIRTMAKVSVSIDRSSLADDVEFNVKSIEVCNCPKSVTPFRDNVVNSADDVYAVGFTRSDSEADALNTNRIGQLSEEAALYLFENMQGEPLGDIKDYRDKVFKKDDPLESRCSYIELTADYISGDYRSLPGKGLIYRLYLGYGAASFNVERNFHYHITVKPEGNGLPECRWRVDKTALEYHGETYLKVTPKGYMRGKIGDLIHIRCNYRPEFAPFDIGTEYLEFDKANGIYDYTVDEDGKGFVLKLTGSGSGLIYIEAGPPVNDAELIIIEVDLES